MRRHLFAPLAASAALAVFVAACGGSATAAPSAAAPSVAASVAASVAPSPSAEASAAPAESTAPAASGALPSFAIPSFNADKDLEALLPSTFGGATLQKLSMKGEQFLGQSSNADFTKALTALGLTTADVSVAVAGDAAVDAAVQFAAIRFAGADSGKLLQVFKAASQASGDLVASVNLGGKDVIKTKDSSGSFSYFYVRNDVVLGVTTKDDGTAAKALAVLP
jgi:hypothetical protein